MKLKNHNEMRIAALTEPSSSLENKTGAWRTFRPILDNNKCIHCMICVNACPDMAIPIKDNKRLETNLDYCKGCLLCVKECPVKALSVKNEADLK